MNLDKLAGRAASSLRESTQVDAESALDALRRLDAQRTIRRRTALAAAASVVLVVMGVSLISGTTEQGHEPLPAPSFAPLGEGYTVIASQVSPSGTSEAVAAARVGQSDVVLVRTTEPSTTDIAWSAPAAQYLGGRNVPQPVAVAWAPDGSKIAVLVAVERGRVDETPHLVDLTLLTLNPDGTERVTVAEVGTCWCTDALPTLTWTDDQVDLGIPDGPDRGHHTEEMS